MDHFQNWESLAPPTSDTAPIGVTLAGCGMSRPKTETRINKFARKFSFLDVFILEPPSNF